MCVLLTYTAFVVIINCILWSYFQYNCDVIETNISLVAQLIVLHHVLVILHPVPQASLHLHFIFCY